MDDADIPSGPTLKPGNARPRILLIEDNPADVELLQLAFRNAGMQYDLNVFQRGGEALAHVARQSEEGSNDIPDLAIIDLNLPQNNGVEILEAMRARPAFANVPVVIFSSSSLPKERERLDELHVTNYVTKPADLDELLAVGKLIESILAGVHAPT